MEAATGKKSSKKKTVTAKRGDIFWVNLDPTIGAEINKTRPALIVANDVACQFARILLIAPITSKRTDVISPFEVAISINGKQSKILLNQCRAVDRSRLTGKILSTDPETMRLVDGALKIAFGLH
ncbi:MAG: plasmid maintenance protein [Parachlamydiales bacterium]|nr:plasmid maintenance protein [Parachlamydiales bacterium]